jgi:uncharacterized PurR-regulated membrane protein YhhQ (DUF165 family)
MYFAITVYAIAMTIANLLVVAFGPAITPVNAFFLIGLDLALRDWLHIKLSAKKMLGLIVATGAITYALNPAAGQIAIASAVAFTAAAFIDWGVFQRLSQQSWIVRSNASNVAGAAVDSLIFPTIAFGVLMPQIVAMQFIAKVAGGAVWSFAIARLNKRIVA